MYKMGGGAIVEQGIMGAAWPNVEFTGLAEHITGYPTEWDFTGWVSKILFDWLFLHASDLLVFI